MRIEGLRKLKKNRNKDPSGNNTKRCKNKRRNKIIESENVRIIVSYEAP